MMNEKDSDDIREEKVNDSESCCSSMPGRGQDCCEVPSDGSGDCCSLGTGKSWKMVVFVVVLLLAGALASHSLLTNDQAATTAGSAGGDEKASDTESAPKVRFIVLSGENEESSKAAFRQVEAVVNMLSAKGKEAVSITLADNTERYQQLAKQFSVDSFPCVIVTGRDGSCAASAIAGEITETNLVRAFVKASTPTASCTPGACGPAGCN